MEFTREAWENAPEGARLEYDNYSVRLIGFRKSGRPVIETDGGHLLTVPCEQLRIILPKRKVTVQLWRHNDSRELTLRHVGYPWPGEAYTLLGEHTFEVEGE